MGDDILHEQEFPCPCGNGVIHVEIYEHDTWTSSGRHKRWWLKCKECEANYTRHNYTLIPTRDAQELERRSKEIYTRRKAVGEVAAQRYLPQFRDYIKGLKFKKSMHPALGGYGGVARFRKETNTPEELDAAIEDSIKSRPAKALEQIHVQDAEIAAELARIEQAEQSLQEYEAKVVKFPAPKVDYLED